jgi:hypothetical protein
VGVQLRPGVLRLHHLPDFPAQLRARLLADLLHLHLRAAAALPQADRRRERHLRGRPGLEGLRRRPGEVRGRPSEKDAKLAQKLGQLQPFLAVLPQECMGQLAHFGPT